MAELLPLPPFHVLKFMDHVSKDPGVPNKKAQEIQAILLKSQDGMIGGDDLRRIVDILEDRWRLLQEFNKLIKEDVKRWRDTKNETHLYGEFPNA